MHNEIKFAELTYVYTDGLAELLINLVETGATPENESLRDSFLDIANYAIIAMMVLDKQWEGVE